MISLFNRKTLPVVLQDQIAECGLASVSMIMHYHKIDADLPSLRAKYPISNLGSTLYDLIDICENEGFIADAYEMNINDFNEMPLPAILHWDLNHFVVLSKIKNNIYTIHDPASGAIHLTKEEFSKHFTGYALSITPSNNAQLDIARSNWNSKNKDSQLTLNYFLKNTQGIGKSIGFIMLMTFVVQLFSMTIPSITQVIIDDFIVSNTTEYLWMFIAGGLGIIVFRFIAEIIKSWSVIFVGYNWHANFSSYFFTKMLKLPIDYFERRSVSDIMSRFNALNELKNALTDRIVQGVIDGIMCIITLSAMFIYNTTLATISLIFCIIYLLLRKHIVANEIKSSNRHIMQKIKENNSFYDSLTNIQSIKIYGKEAQRYQQWKKHYLNTANESIELTKAKMWYVASEGLLAGIENILILGASAYIVISGEITFGMMFAFFAYQNIFSEQSKSMINNGLSLKLLGVHLDRLSDIEANKTERNLHGITDGNFEITGKIELRNISFRYPGADKNIIDNFSLVIEPMQNVVFTGPSGCGKSTLLKIIMGLIEPDSGEVLIDGVNIHQIGLRKYRKSIAAISQKESLITGTVTDNIAFFSSPVDMEKVIYSAEKACIHKEIMKQPMQYQTITGGFGSNFSGGQEQKILLARALYHSPKILFLDEATSFLDSLSEMQIVSTLKDLQITRISVAHRAETIKMADIEIKLGR